MRELLSDFIDHTLHWRTARTLDAHLAACPPCRVYVTTVERTILLYRERPVVDVPPAVRGHLREVLRERHERAPAKRAGRCCAAASRAAAPTSTPVKRAPAPAPAKRAAAKAPRKA
jgi:predicted anti-sigma-YlaC factor YlaD